MLSTAKLQQLLSLYRTSCIKLLKSIVPFQGNFLNPLGNTSSDKSNRKAFFTSNFYLVFLIQLRGFRTRALPSFSNLVPSNGSKNDPNGVKMHCCVRFQLISAFFEMTPLPRFMSHLQLSFVKSIGENCEHHKAQQ